MGPVPYRARVIYIVLFCLVMPGVVLLGTILGCRAEKRQELLVGAASNLMPAFTELARGYKTVTGRRVKLSFASSGTLAAQVRQGAPLDVAAFASPIYAAELAEKGFLDGESVTPFARGVLVVAFGPSYRGPAFELEDLLGPSVTRVAIANPSHAPYGKAAEQALRHAGLWEALVPKLVYGENVAATLGFLRSGNAEAALVPLSLVAGKGWHYFQVPEGSYDPPVQVIAVVSSSNRKDAAREFIEYIIGPEGRRIMVDYGYGPAGGGAP